MEDIDNPSPEYIKGFNEGYLLAKHSPDLVEKLPKDLGVSDRSKGFAAGREQYIIEQQKDRQPAWLKKDRLSNLNRESKDKGDLDKD